MGKQLAQPGDSVRGNARQDIVEPRERLDAARLAGSDETAKYGRRFPPAVTTEKGPVPAAESNVAVGSFRGAVVYLQLAVLQKLSQCLPLVQRICCATSSLPPFCKYVVMPVARKLCQLIFVTMPAAMARRCRRLWKLQRGQFRLQFLLLN
jgi:hypothetical protein